MSPNEQTEEAKRVRVQIAETRLEPIWNALVEILTDPKNVIPKLEEYTFKSASAQQATAKIADAEQQVASLKQKRGRIATIYGDGAITLKEYKLQMAECGSRIIEAQNQAAKYRQLLVKREERKDRDVILNKLYAKVKSRLQNPSYEDKQYILHLFIERINLFYSKNYAEVFFRFPATASIGTGKEILGRGDDAVRLVLHIKVLSLKERQREILATNVNNMRDKGFTSTRNPRLRANRNLIVRHNEISV